MVFRRPGYAQMVALPLVAALLLVPGSPPVNPLFRLLANASAAGPPLASVLLLVGLSVLVLAAGAALTGFVAARRDPWRRGRCRIGTTAGRSPDRERQPVSPTSCRSSRVLAFHS